jgi:hypothetical protein
MGLWMMALRLMKKIRMRIWKNEDWGMGILFEYSVLAGLLVTYFLLLLC